MSEIDAINEDQTKRFHAYPLLCQALRNCLASFSHPVPEQHHYEHVSAAANLLYVLGEHALQKNKK